MSQPAEVTPNSVPDAASPLRFVTAASLFDGHDAAINIMRRLIQARGVEVIHLGHNRSVQDIVDAAVQEDADAIAVSSYQGGHMEFFRYMVDRLRELGIAVHAAFMLQPEFTEAQFAGLRDYVRRLPPAQCSFTV